MLPLLWTDLANNIWGVSSDLAHRLSTLLMRLCADKKKILFFCLFVFYILYVSLTVNIVELVGIYILNNSF